MRIVTKVERTLCHGLSGVTRTGSGTVSVPEGVVWEEINTRKHPSLQISDKIDDKARLYTATLKFYTCDDMKDRERYAYRVTLIDGNCLLIGNYERPYPITTAVDSMPEKPTDNQWLEVTVTWTSPWQIPQIG